MRAQGIISDIILNVRRGKCDFTFHELLGMMKDTQREAITWAEFLTALELCVRTGEVKSSLPVGHAQFVNTGVFTPGRTI